MNYFGTDGVRGVAGVDLTCELAFRLARAAGRAFRPQRVLLAQDTRLSGPALASACAAGLAEAQLDGTGRLVVRPSGTQPLIRIMAEGPDVAALHALVSRVAGEIAQEGR